VTVGAPVVRSDRGFRHPVDVRFFEVDSLGVVFNMWYLGWCDEAMSGYLDSLGYGYATLRARGLDAVLRKAELDWVDSLQAFERAEIAVRAEHLGSTSFRLGYEVRRVTGDDPDGTVCATISITYVCVEVAGRTSTPLPSGLRAALQAGSS
jgi:acyl-CoA thioester hydrolase